MMNTNKSTGLDISDQQFQLPMNSFQSFNTLMDSVPGAFYRMEPELVIKFSFVSKNGVGLFGKPVQEILSAVNPFQFYDTVDSEAFDSKLCKVRRGLQGKGIVKYRILDTRGKVRSIKDTFNAVYDSYGNLLCIEGYLEEISFNKISLLNKLNAYKDAVDINIISSMTDTKGIITHVNDNFCKISKYSRSELIGQNHNIIRSEYHSKEFFAQMWRTIGLKKAWYGEILNKAKDGSLYWVDTVIIPLVDVRSRVESYLSLRILITSRKDSERKSLLYQHALEELAFFISHKLRGPVCSMQGLAHLLRNEKDPDMQHKIIAHTLECIDKLEGISRQASRFVHQHEINFRIDEETSKLYTKYPPDTIAYVYSENSF